MADHAPTKRVIEILRFLAKERGGCSLSEIARGVGSPVSTCAMILRTLSNAGMLEYRAQTRRYRIGFGIHALASAYAGMHTLLRGAVGEMQRIADALGERCELGVLDGADVLCIARVEPPESVRSPALVGVRIPACCTAAGKTLLADADMDRLHELYGASLPALTPHSLTRFEELAIQLKAIREGGIAKAFREAAKEAVSYALPLRFREQLAASLSVTVPIVRSSSEKEAQVVAELHKGQRRIEALMDARGESLASGGWAAILPFTGILDVRKA